MYFSEMFFISLTWAIVILILVALISILLYLYNKENDVSYTAHLYIRDHLEDARLYIKELEERYKSTRN